MFTAFGFSVENSFALDVNDTADDMSVDSNNIEKLENSQNDEILEVDSRDSQDLLGEPRKPTGNTFQSIQDQIKAASPGETILLSGTYYPNGLNHISINKKLTITADSTATLDGQHVSRAFDIGSNAAGTVIKNIKFINCNGEWWSGIFVETKNVRIENCIFEDNHAKKWGAVTTRYDLDTSSGLIVDNCQFRRNTAYFDGFIDETSAPALSMYGRDSEVKNSVFEDNWVKSLNACYGGAIQVGLDEPGSNAKVTSCIFKNNKAISINGASHGGAGCVRDGSAYTDCIFINNFADEGGALTFHASGEIKNCTFINNSASNYGGALSTGLLYDYMELSVVNCNFYGNTAPMGGAIQANGLNVAIEDSNFKDNLVTKYGGAVYVRAEDVTIKNSVFNSNKANIDGGAVYIEGKNTHVEKSSFVSNEAIPDASKLDDGLGGAIYIDSSQALITDNSFRYNTARNGSAIYYDKSGEKLTLQNNELYQNQAWVYALPISAKDIYFGDSEEISVILYGGNNIGDFDNLAVSNAIYNDAENVNIMIDNHYPLYGATDTGDLYQDDREYDINVLLTVEHEDGTLVYNEVGFTSYLGEIKTTLNNLKPGTYYVTAKHYEDNYYKGITNVTTFIVHPKVDNEITKSVSNNNPNFQDVVIWTISVKNNGPNDSTDVKVFDVLPKGLTWINDTAGGRYNHDDGILDIGDLKVNETFTFNIITIIDATGDIVNGAKVNSSQFDIDLTNNYAEKGIHVNPASDLAVIKSVSNTEPNYNDRIVWTVKITNNGPDIAHNVVMSDLLSKSLIFVGCDGDYDENTGIWNVGTLDVGKSVTLNIESIVNATGLIENFVKVNGSEFDYDLTNNNDTERIFVNPASDLAIDKEVDASSVNFNDVVKWTLTIVNNGPDSATNVKVIDILPDGFTYLNSTLTKGNYTDDIFSIEHIAVGEKVIIEIFTLVETTGDFINYANVSSDEHDYNLTNNEDEEKIHVNPAADLAVTKSVSDSNPQYKDIITWTIEVINNGPDIAHNVTLMDLLPDCLLWMDDDSLGDYNPITGKLFIEELDVEEVFVLNIECMVDGTGLIENWALVNASEYDYNQSNNKDNETIDVEKSADVSVIKSVNNTSPNYNDLVKWTLTITNAGPDNATDINVEDQLPEGLVLVDYNLSKGVYADGLWRMCCLNVGDVQTLEIICRVNKTREITNFASIHANEHDSNETNNVDNETIDVPLAVDMQVVIEVNNTSPLFGEMVNWMISVRNNGPDNATGVFLEDILPEELIFSSYQSSTGIYEDGIWNIGSVNVGDVVYLNISTVCDALGEITDNVRVNSTEYDWNMSNNIADKQINVRPVADVSIIKLVSNKNPNYGEKIKWTLIAKNMGPNVANNVYVRDVLPDALTFISSNGDYSGGVWNIGSLDVGEEKSLVIVCKVASTGNIINKANIWADELDPDESNNYAEASIIVAPASDLSVTKLASKYYYRVGDVIEYVIEVVNNGPDTAKNIRVTDILDDLLKLKSFKAFRGSFNKFTNVWTIKNLGYGESTKLIIKVIALGSGIVKNTVSVTSDTFDYDKSNNKDYAIVNISDKPSNKVLNNPKNKLNDKAPSNLEIHPTANPVLMLLVCLVCSIIFLGDNISKRR